MRLIFQILTFIISFNYANGQVKEITLEDIWQKNIFTTKTIQQLRWMKDSQYFTSLENGIILKKSVIDDAFSDVIFDGNKHNLKINSYLFSENEQKVLISTNFESKFRHSGLAEYYVYDLKSNTLLFVSENGKMAEVSFSPDIQKIAFIRNNDLYYKVLASKLEIKVSKNGQKNSVINGATDWVYEEEFGFTKAYEWSPDGSKLAYISFDETAVPEYKMQIWGGIYPTELAYKYPKAGENNSIISVFFYDLLAKTTLMAEIGHDKTQYIPKIQWTNTSNQLAVWQLNRKQNDFNLLHINAQNGASKVIYHEQNDKYLQIREKKLFYLNNSKSFFITNELDGFMHIYQYDNTGKLIRQITKGNWEVTDIKGIDEIKKLIYYISTEVSPLERHLFSIQYEPVNNGLKKSKKDISFSPIKRKLSLSHGTNKIDLSADFKYFIESNSAFNKPLSIQLFSAEKANSLKTYETNELLKQKINDFGIKPMELFSFKIPEGDSLNGFMIKPPNFDPVKKYPVVINVYGGPRSQRVTNEWAQRPDFYWHQLLAQKGYIIVAVDNRGTDARGKVFREITYGNLGKYEVEDQTNLAKYLGNLPYVDKTRIGIWGWSYGGFMAANCILQANEIFKAAIAVAPVTNWRYYDTIYTERYNGLPSENPNGYDQNSPINHVAKLKGQFLLIHGTGDDNVHFQNSMALQDALIAENKQFTSFFYPNRNHSISGGNTRLHLYKLMTDWLLKTL